MTQLTLEPVYLLDTSCVPRLDGRDGITEFSTLERALIWDGLELLTQDGRLKIIKQVKEELKRLYPQGLARFTQYPPHILTLRRTAQIVDRYQQIIVSYPDIAPRPGRDSADPWLLLTAQKYMYTIVTQELSLSARSPRTNKKLRIPDICALESIQCINLRQLANHEGWLTTL